MEELERAKDRLLHAPCGADAWQCLIFQVLGRRRGEDDRRGGCSSAVYGVRIFFQYLQECTGPESHSVGRVLSAQEYWSFAERSVQNLVEGTLCALQGGLCSVQRGPSAACRGGLCSPLQGGSADPPQTLCRPSADPLQTLEWWHVSLCRSSRCRCTRSSFPWRKV